MATRYVNSGATGANNGTSKADAFTTMGGAAAVWGAGDVIYVAHTHSENTGNHATYTPPAGLMQITVINFSTDAPTAGAAITTGGNFSLSIPGVTGAVLWVYGLSMTPGSNANNGSFALLIGGGTAANYIYEFDNCSLGTNTTNSSAGAGRIRLGGLQTSAVGGLMKFRNTTLNLPNVASTGGVVLFGQSNIELHVSAINYLGASKPSALFGWGAVQFIGCVKITGDLTGFNTSSGAYFNVAGFGGGSCYAIGCKLNSTPAIVTGTWGGSWSELILDTCDDGNTSYNYEYRNRQGTATADTSTYANVGDEGEVNGQSLSWAFATTADCNEFSPFYLPEMSIFATTSNTAFRAEVLTDGVTLTDREAWLEAWVPNGASDSGYGYYSDRCATPGAGGANQASSSETWTNSASSPVKQKLEVTATPARDNVVRLRAAIAKASTSGYICPTARAA